MIIERYLRPDETTLTDCYHEAGRFPLEDAARLVLRVGDGRLSPDPSGLWLVTVPIEVDDS